MSGSYHCGITRNDTYTRMCTGCAAVSFRPFWRDCFSIVVNRFMRITKYLDYFVNIQDYLEFFLTRVIRHNHISANKTTENQTTRSINEDLDCISKEETTYKASWRNLSALHSWWQLLELNFNFILGTFTDYIDLRMGIVKDSLGTAVHLSHTLVVVSFLKQE